ncbi:hypothetical protein DFJ74DRAFT_665456 [Hyaloraphidium curvatum]|nr:hypothetical protein DFJ74DRAFT_665456 [Hyaloraphidium curvatum]
MAGQPGAGFPHLTGGTPPPMVLIQHPEVPGTALSISQAQYAQLLQNQAALGGLAAQGAIPAQYYQQAAPNLHISHVAVPPPQQASIAVPHDIPDPPQGRGKGRVFQCPHCDRTFTRKHNLLSHELTHGGEKAHKCEFCDQMVGCLSERALYFIGF